MVAGVSPETSLAWISAVSVSGSVPRIVASAWLPSLNETVSEPPSPASSTTWLLVRIRPSELRMMPEPEPEPWLPITSIFTTEGSTLAATAWTLPSAAGVLGVSTTLDADAVDPGVADDVLSSCQEVYAAAPTTPAPAPTSREVATTVLANTMRRPRGEVVGGCGGVGEEVAAGPACGRQDGGFGGIGAVSFTRTTMAGPSVTILRHRWVSQKN